MLTKMTGCYILYSKKLGKFYIGAIQEDVASRIKKHNEAAYGKHRFTAKSNDWELFLFIETQDYSHAVRIERKIKPMKSLVYLRNLAAYPKMVTKLLIETKQST